MWELLFFMVVLKLPIVYLCGVVWWAIRAEPRPPEPAALLVPVDPEPSPWSPWARRPRRPRPGPHGAPDRGYARTARAALARAEVER